MSSENASKIDILVEAWGYNDLLNEPTFEELPYYIHVFVGIFISVLCKKKFYKPVLAFFFGGGWLLAILELCLKGNLLPLLQRKPKFLNIMSTP